jgi:uncharacterized protein GlcG (DUF336 family)
VNVLIAFLEKKSISLEMADLMTEAAVNKAVELGILVNAAIVDEGSHLVSFRRMDNAAIMSIDIAINKAYTSVAFGLPTNEWYPLISQEPSLLQGIVHTSRLIVFGGGFPVKIGDDIIGGIGVSGGTIEQDMACCAAAISVLSLRKEDEDKC